jgi:hypothetical protein
MSSQEIAEHVPVPGSSGVLAPFRKVFPYRPWPRGSPRWDY